MTIRNSAAILFLLSPALLISMETKEQVKADVLDMVRECKEICIYRQYHITSCVSKCMADYSKQKEYFLIRKYTQECAHLPFDETWFFKTNIEDEVKNVVETHKAYDKWQNPVIAECAKKRLAHYTEQCKALEIDAHKDLDNFNIENFRK